MNLVIQAKKSKINAIKRFRKLGVWIVGKKLRPHPKPQIQDAELRRRRLGIRTIPYVFGEERRIKKL